jgi:hypothetical protein
MFYIQVAHARWNKPVSPDKRKPRNSKPSETEARTDKSSKYAQNKTKEYVRNAQRVYFYERRMFS